MDRSYLDLTAIEDTILRSLARGQSVREIAVARGVSPKTVQNQISIIKIKLRVDTTFELGMVAATRYGSAT